jgi:hypothetical protein
MVPSISREVGLVSCVKTKRAEPAVPKDLYTSTYFEKMRAYAEAEHDEWWILSAKYGLLDPDGDPIEPYDETMTDATTAERRAWAEDVFAALDQAGLLAPDVRLVIHAGSAYTEELVPMLEESAVGEIQLPTKGLQIGKRLAWYSDRL